MRLKVMLGLLGAGVLLALLTIWLGTLRLDRSTARLIDTLDHAHRGTAGPVDFARFERLPPPVMRYLRRVLQDGQPLISVARLSQKGELRTDPQSTRWLPFEAKQLVAPLAPGFVGDARVSVLPGIHVRVRDAYVSGHGSGRVSLLSAIPVASDSGRPELNSGALHRYLAEAVWYPTALLPSEALEWSPINGEKALATLTDAGLTVSLEFWFSQAGEITGVFSSGRWGRFDGEYRRTAWEGHFRNYQEREGMLVPSEGEVGWYRGSEWQGVWKGELARAECEFAGAATQ